jgi:DNA-binding transcriptional ArsR family regulator
MCQEKFLRFFCGENYMNKYDIILNEEALEMIANRFRMLSEPTRLRILGTLGEKEMTVTELVAATGGNQGNVSKHLNVLLQAGIVSRRKAGLTANYRISDPTIFALCELVSSRLQEDLEKRRNSLVSTRGNSRRVSTN